MPTWCHMFNSTLTGSARVWFDDLLSKSVDSYDDLKEAFLANFRQHKKCIKDPVEIHHIKQKEGKSTKDFMRRFKIESRDVKGAPKVMRISGFMHGNTNPKLIKQEEGTEGPIIIEAETRGRFIHRMYVDGGSALKILYEHCFNRLRPESNGYGHCLLNRVQWQNHMAVRTNITTGEDCRRGTFNLGLDELYDSK
nr:reverse transcriptase domain-containing protein [Tanacetum cinerariifolium]